MLSLLEKEIRLFFSGPLAYLALFVFFVANALILFVLPTKFNIFDGGYATLEPFFDWIPWVFLFLIPAICMRAFSEEKKTGTMEVLLTRPLSSRQIVMAKYAACLLLMFVSLLPTFSYLHTVSALAAPRGNIDLGAFWGAYLGLLLIGAAFTAVCLFMSSLTDNQVVAFVLSVVACAVLYQGFGLFGAMSRQGSIGMALASLGMQHHYVSMSRGVIDLRDVAYFLLVIVVFLALTERVAGMRAAFSWKKDLLLACILAVMSVLASLLPVRLDLTSDKRYTLMPVTKQILRENPAPVYVRVYLTGDLPAGFKRLEKAVREMLDEFRVHDPSIRYQFVDLYEMEDDARRQERMQELAQRGIAPTQLEVRTKEGLVRRLVFPAAELMAGDRSVAVGLLQEQLGRGAEETLNHSIENVEVQLAAAMRALFDRNPDAVAFLEGNGELGYRQTLSFGNALSMFYNTSRVRLDADPHCLLVEDSAGRWRPRYSCLVVAHPTLPFEDAPKAVLDQYVMYGGKVLWLLDPGDGSVDSLRGKDLHNAMLYDLRLDDMFFRYGFRLRDEMLLDRNASASPVVTGYMGNQPVIEYIPNFYCPVIEAEAGRLPAKFRPLAEGVAAIRMQVAAGIDTIENSVGKTVLLQTSPYSFRVSLPHAMSADLMREHIDIARFNQGPQIVAVWLEGSFPTAFPLIKPALEEAGGFAYRRASVPTAMMVVGDGDMARNDWSMDGQVPFPLGFDRYTGQMYGNGDFLVNAVHLLTGHPQWAMLKPRVLPMRLLDKAGLEQKRQFYTVFNFAVPLGCVLAFGLWFTWRRKRKYGRPVPGSFEPAPAGSEAPGNGESA